ncbi:MAG: LamG domain-containing protein, partial [Candidatus Pacebacteria bacterium]|nr:LamG domain-containing protein [Candidatus Paceibacterota bacterium]
KTGNENDGTIHGATYTTDQMGQSNRAMSFDGVDDYIDLDIDIPATVTISAWAKSDNVVDDMLWCIGNTGSGGPDLFFHQDLISLNTWDGSGNSFCSMPSASFLAEWHLYTTIIESGNTKLYIDNELCGTADYKDPTNTSFAISSSNSYDWDGSISDARIYKGALDADEIQSLYEQYRPKTQVSNLQKGLVGQWALDSESLKSSTITGDKTPYENDGTISGAILTTDQMGQSNRAMSFDGTDDYVSIGDNDVFDISEEITISAWIKPTAFPSRGGILVDRISNSTTGYLFTTVSSGLSFGSYNGSSWDNVLDTSSGELTLNEWQYVVTTFKSNDQAVIYVNGQSVASKSVSGSMYIPTTHNIVIGREAYPEGSQFFNGSISDVRIYNRALNTTEINDLYHSYRPKISPGSLQKGLVGSWPLDTESEKTKQGGFDVSTAVYDSVFSVSGQTTSAKGLAFNTDGSKMFVSSYTEKAVHEYHCSTDFDVSTCSHDSSFGVSSYITELCGIAFNTDGTKLFAVDFYSANDISEFHCTTGFDVSTCSYDSAFGVGGQDGNPRGMAFNTEGTRMFVGGTTGDNIYEYHCSTGFDVSTCSYDSTLSISSQDGSAHGITFNTDGSKMFIVGNIGNDVNEYHCSAAFDVSTCSYDSIFSVASQETDPQGLAFNIDGSKMFVVGNVGNDINEYHLDPPVSITGDKTPYSNDGTITGPTSTTGKDGESDGALSFDGVDDNIDLGDADELDFERTDAFSISIWYKGTDTSGAVISKMNVANDYQGYDVYITGGYIKSHIISTWPTNALAETGTLYIVNDNEWHHLVITYDGSSDSNGLKLFVDNKEETTVIQYDLLSATISNSVSNRIASRSSGSAATGTYTSGSISDVKIYDRALSAEEVDLLYHRR